MIEMILVWSAAALVASALKVALARETLTNIVRSETRIDRELEDLRNMNYVPAEWSGVSDIS